MNDIVASRYRDWTEGLDKERSVVNIFEKIRDIPYYVIAEHLELETGPAGMLRENKGSCYPKHYLMGKMYQDLGLRVRYHTYPFYWKDLDIDWADVVGEMAAALPVAYHMALSVYNHDRWVLADATWDLGLEKLGFAVNSDWDGRNDTRLAVKPLDEFVHEEAAERHDEFKVKLEEYSLPEKLALARFSIELNRWLEKVRKEQ
ncbi:MAG: hypothetical protein GF409_03435 [Candidatus Omnitrophica bacterium]|nr:hypothetical protein [Candidatus Omnitrophota bacterium]